MFSSRIATLQNQDLTDQKDENYAALQSAYTFVSLTNLDGSGYLHGDWANVKSSTGPLAYSSDNIFSYNRKDDQFEQVMAYYWITEAQNYIESLDFGNSRRPINKEAQDVRINQYGIDNSYSKDKKDLLRFGKGGVDDAEDAEVILHEYGHAMMDSQVIPFGFGILPVLQAGILFPIQLSNLTACEGSTVTFTIHRTSTASFTMMVRYGQELSGIFDQVLAAKSQTPSFLRPSLALPPIPRCQQQRRQLLKPQKAYGKFLRNAFIDRGILLNP